MLLNPYRFGSTWTPASLFAGGEKGWWLDISDISTLYQDSAATTPVTASGQPVGYVADKSGNGYHAKQSTASARPVYTVSGAYAYLDCDGVDDRMLTDNFTAFSATAAHGMVGIYKSSAAYNYDRFLSLRSSNAVVDYGSDSAAALVLYSTNASGGGIATYRSAFGPTITTTMNQVQIIDAAQTATHQKIGLNGGTMSAASKSPSASLSIGCASFGTDGSTGGFVRGRIYFSLWINREMTSDERAALLTYVNARVGAF